MRNFWHSLILATAATPSLAVAAVPAGAEKNRRPPLKSRRSRSKTTRPNV